MDRAAFEYLYIHANCLAELALDQLARELDGCAPDLPAGSEEQALALLGQMDTAALRDGWDGGAGFGAQVRREIGALQQDAPQLPAEGGGADSGEFDLAVYLHNAYAARSQIAVRVDDAMARLDLAMLARLAHALPAELPALTEPLDADQLALWLVRYQAGDAALDDIVVLIGGQPAC